METPTSAPPPRHASFTPPEQDRGWSLSPILFVSGHVLRAGAGATAEAPPGAPGGDKGTFAGSAGRIGLGRKNRWDEFGAPATPDLAAHPRPRDPIAPTQAPIDLYPSLRRPPRVISSAPTAPSGTLQPAQPGPYGPLTPIALTQALIDTCRALPGPLEPPGAASSAPTDHSDTCTRQLSPYSSVVSAPYSPYRHREAGRVTRRGHVAREGRSRGGHAAVTCRHAVPAAEGAPGPTERAAGAAG